MRKRRRSLLTPTKETSEERERRLLKKKISKLHHYISNAATIPQGEDQLLQTLTHKWTEVCQQALHILLQCAKEQHQHINMEELLKQLHVPPDMVNYDLEEQEFRD